MPQSRFLLEVENKRSTEVTDFHKVQKAIEGLRSHGKSSFAILSSNSGDYIQVAGGIVTCVLERRLGSEHSRAYVREPKVPFEGTQVISCGAGMLKVQPEEILFAEDAVAAFRAFFTGGNYPENILWRDYDYNLEHG